MSPDKRRAAEMGQDDDVRAPLAQSPHEEERQCMDHYPYFARLSEIHGGQAGSFASRARNTQLKS
jgi:hypothetical protein